ncbi:hypothetical protein [Pseudomonas aeruginosa]|uniref:hypothetical protein n=1 Tax=Pseudomonas aeruginosa TaxID=287 RepID=UPI002E29FF06|nr:hypothetical protein [Pseudomonas aeruginosa]
MKKLLFAFLLSLTLIGCSGDSVHRSSNELSKEDISHSLFFNMMEVIFTCELTQTAADFVQTGDSLQKAKYECQGENNPFADLSGIISIEDKTIAFITKAFLTFALIVGFIFTIMYYSTGNKILTLNNTGKVLEIALNVLFRYKARIIICVAVVAGYMLVFGFIQEIDKEKLYKERSVEIPHFSVKNTFVKSIFDYQLCVKSSDFEPTGESPNIRIFKTNNGYRIEAQYKYCELTGGFAIDTQGNEIAKLNNLFDYESMQEQAITKNLNKLIAKTELVAQRTVIAQNTYDVVKIPEILTCTNTPISYSGLTDEDKSEVIWKDLECAGREFVVEMSKFNGMTEERMDTLSELTGTRRVHICEGEFTDQPFTNKEGMLEKYRACISSNCSESGSTYSCGVALSKFNEMNQDKKIDFLTLSTYSVFENEPEIRSAKMFLGTLSAQLTFENTPAPFTIERNEMVSFPVSTSNTTSQMSYQKVVDFLNKVDLLTWKKAALSFSVSDFINRQLDPDNGGLYGIGRFLDCSTSFFSMTLKNYDCGTFQSESKLLADTFYASATQLVLMKNLMKPKSGREKLKKTDTGYQAAQAGFNSFGINKRIVAYALPFLADYTGSMLFEDVFQENYHRVMGQKGEYYTALLCIELSQTCADSVETVSVGLYTGYAIFGWVIPFAPYFIMIGFLARYHGKAIYRAIINIMYFIIKYGSEQVRRDVDKHDLVIFIEDLILKPLAIGVYFVFSQIMFYVIMIFYIEDIRGFTGSVFGLNAQTHGMTGEIIVTVFSLMFVYFFYIVSLMIWISGVNSIDDREGNVTSSDGRIQNAAELRSYAKAMKGKGMD